MLSILIPTYDYNISKLVNKLVQQCKSAQISYEIICQDDHSNSSKNSENELINTIENCFFYQNPENYGRSKNRNLLVQKSKYDWLLFLDCDMMPLTNDYINKYVNIIKKSSSEVFFGGIVYQQNKPSKNQLLRWIYGKKRETLSLKKREENPNSSALTSNFLIQKTTFLRNLFDEELTKYGFEDSVFFSSLEHQGKFVKHIDNACLHHGLETSSEFILKTKIAIENLVFLSKKKDHLILQKKLVKSYKKIKKNHLHKITIFLFKVFKAPIERNLTSSFPSLFLFDLYKLGYYSTLMSNQSLK